MKMIADSVYLLASHNIQVHCSMAHFLKCNAYICFLFLLYSVNLLCNMMFSYLLGAKKLRQHITTVLIFSIQCKFGMFSIIIKYYEQNVGQPTKANPWYGISLTTLLSHTIYIYYILYYVYYLKLCQHFYDTTYRRT